MEKENQSVEHLTHGLLEELQLKCYGKETLDNYRRILKNLALYMQLNELSTYSSEIGKAFVGDYISTHEISVSFQKTISTVIGRLNDYCDGREYSPQQRRNRLLSWQKTMRFSLKITCHFVSRMEIGQEPLKEKENSVEIF
jgi:hypothetical protein